MYGMFSETRADGQCYFASLRNKIRQKCGQSKRVKINDGAVKGRLAFRILRIAGLFLNAAFFLRQIWQTADL